MATVPVVAVSKSSSLDGLAVPRPTVGSAARPLAVSRIVRDALVIIGLLLLNRLGSGGAVAFFLVLAAMMLYSPQAAYKAMAIAMLGLMVNTAFVPKTLVWTPARLLIFPLALLRFLSDISGRRVPVFSSPTYLFFMLYVVTMAFCSVASGWLSQIALLKLLMFWIAITAVLAGTAVLRAKGVDMTEWTVSLIAAASMLGFLSIAMGVQFTQSDPNLRVTVGFIGAFLHPNNHSLFATLFVTFLACLAVMGSYERRWIAVALIPVWLTFMARSAARTSFAAMFAGLLILFIMNAPLRDRRGWRLRVNISRSRLVLFGVAVAIGLLLYDVGTNQSLTRAVVAFINKGAASDEQVNVDVALQSRLPLIQHSYNTFLENPLHGIGFQVSKDESFLRRATIFTAPVEKGFLPTAVLEEGGVLGAVTFVLFVIALYWDLFAARNVPAIAILTTFLTSNFGEVSLFSVGGAGAFGWVMVGLAMILGDHCWRAPRVHDMASVQPGVATTPRRHALFNSGYH